MKMVLKEEEEEEEIIFEETRTPKDDPPQKDIPARVRVRGHGGTRRNSHDRQQKHRPRQYHVAPMTISMRLADLIKALWSTNPNTVTTSLIQIYALVDERNAKKSSTTNTTMELSDNTLELGVVRKGGQLALLHALRAHPTVDAIQALGFGALSWLCETCNIKSALVGKGAVPLACAILTNKAHQPMVLTEALYFLGHLSTLPKVAEQLAVRDTSVLHHVIASLSRGSIDTKSSEQDESSIDAMFFLCQRLSAHHSMSIWKNMLNAGCLTFVVRHLQDSLAEYQADHGCLPGEEARMEGGCRILTSWVKTRCGAADRSKIVQRLIEAGALTVAAELVRLFPLGAPLRRVANPCLRAMVPVSDD